MLSGQWKDCTTDPLMVVDGRRHMKRITAIHIQESPSSLDPAGEFAYVANIQYQDETGIRSFEDIGIPDVPDGVVNNLFHIVTAIHTFKKRAPEP